MIMRILFLCMDNSCVSQMAEGLAEMLARGVPGVSFFSAGFKPAGSVNPLAILVMKEKGMDISGYRPKGLEELPFREFDIIVDLGGKDAAPFLTAKQYFKWTLPYPESPEIVFFRLARDLIGAKVAGLLRKIAEEISSKSEI